MKYSIARELMKEIPVFKKDTDLEVLIKKVMNSKEYQALFEKYGIELQTEEVSYQKKMKEIVEQLIR